MTSRSHGGSADLLEPQTIELMHHRRLVTDDARGVDEPLDEYDIETNYGNKVNAKYYMHMFDRSKGQSKQRDQ